MNLLKVAAHGAGFFQRAHKGQHHAQVGAAVHATGQLEGFNFPVVDIARNTTVAKHGVVFDMFEEAAAKQVAVFVALEVGGTVRDGLAVEGHGKERKVLGQGLDVVFLTGTEATGLDHAADFVRKVTQVVHFFFQARTQAHFFTQAVDIIKQLGDSGQFADAAHLFVNAGFNFRSALASLGIRRVQQGQSVVVTHDDAHMVGQIVGGLEHFNTARGHFEVLVNLVIELAHFAVLQQHVFCIEAFARFGKSFNLGGKAGNFAHVFTQVEVEHNKTGGHLLAQHLGKAVFKLFQLVVNHVFKLAAVKSLQSLRMDADVTQHEFRTQQTHLKLRKVAQPREEQRLTHVGQHKADLGFGRGQLGKVHFAAHKVQGQKAAIYLAACTVNGHFRAVEGTQHVKTLNTDNRSNTKLARGNGRVAGVAAHIGHDGRGHAHTRNHVRVGAFGCKHVALGDLVQLKGRTQKAHRALASAA